MADIKDILGGFFGGLATGDPFAYRNNQLKQQQISQAMQMALEKFKMEGEQHKANLDLSKAQMKQLELSMKTAQEKENALDQPAFFPSVEVQPAPVSDVGPDVGMTVGSPEQTITKKPLPWTMRESQGMEKSIGEKGMQAFLQKIGAINPITTPSKFVATKWGTILEQGTGKEIASPNYKESSKEQSELGKLASDFGFKLNDVAKDPEMLDAIITLNNKIHGRKNTEKVVQTDDQGNTTVHIVDADKRQVVDSINLGKVGKSTPLQQSNINLGTEVSTGVFNPAKGERQETGRLPVTKQPQQAVGSIREFETLYPEMLTKRGTPEYQSAFLKHTQGKGGSHFVLEGWDEETGEPIFRDTKSTTLIPGKGTGKAIVPKNLPESARTGLQEWERGNSLVSKLEKEWNALPHEEGIPGRVHGILVKGAGWAGLAPNVKSYQDFAFGVLAPLIRSVGEKGNLSNQDIERAINLIPKYPDTKTEAENKLRMFKEWMADAKKSIQKTATMGASGLIKSKKQESNDPLGIR